MVIVFWFLTPMQSALLGTDVIQQAVSVNISRTSQLLALKEQVSAIDPEILNTGYAIGWLNQSFPSFTTSKYALLPYYTQNNPAPPDIVSNWTAETTQLSTELSCWPAEIEQDGPRSKSSFNFLNGQGCNTTVSFNYNANFSMFYIGYRSNAYSDHWLGGPWCPPNANSTHQFLALWARPVPVSWDPTPDFNITALFCQPQYYKQQVMAKVESRFLKPDGKSIQALRPREILSEEEFNSTAFEHILAHGMAERPIVKDYPYNSVVEQHPRLNYTGLTRPVSNMVGFALAGRDLPTTDYASPDLLAEIYHEAHQYLFSVAVSKLLTNGTQSSNTTASVEFFLVGVVVSRLFATALECVLVLVAVFTAVTLWLCRIAPSNLSMNPSSIARHAHFLHDSSRLIAQLKLLDNANDVMLLDSLRDSKLCLHSDGTSNTVEILPNEPSADVAISKRQTSLPQKGHFDPIRPWALRRASGLLFGVSLIGAIIGLSYLKQQETLLNGKFSALSRSCALTVVGLHRPSENFEILQLLENYIPTLFATLIEPFWVLLNRLLCVLQPFKDLWEGSAKPSSSIDAIYTSIPPQLVFWRALKSRHFVLVLVCMMALLANLLAVGLGSLFNESPMIAHHTEAVAPIFAPRFDNQSVTTLGRWLSENLITTTKYQDHMYVALANFTAGTPLPPWVSHDYFFQRYDLGSVKVGSSADTYSLETQGFGVHANCTAIPTFKLPHYIPDTRLEMPEEELDKTCSQKVLVEWAAYEMRQTETNRSSSVSSVEFSKPRTTFKGEDPCNTALVLGWGRTAKAEDLNATADASMAICIPIFETAKFNISIDKDGHVLAYQRTSELKHTLDYPDSNAHTHVMFKHYNSYWNNVHSQWHNDTVARDWMNYFISILNNTRSHLDPNEPVPNPDIWIPSVENIYRRQYALMLGLNDRIFDQNDIGAPTSAIRKTEEIRIFMEHASFIITMIILSLNLMVASLFYFRAVAFILPRMPTTVGSILTYIAPSRLTSSISKRIPGQSDRTYSFGRYVGLDGQVHLGVELDPHVIRVNTAIPKGAGALTQLRSRFLKTQVKATMSESWL